MGDTNICVDDGFHNMIVINWNIRPEQRRATQFMCSKCLRMFDHTNLHNRHAHMNEEEEGQKFENLHDA